VKHGLLVANIGTYADPRAFVGLAQEAERAGWDAVLIWDHLAFAWGMPAADPWVTLGATAVSTERVLLGTGVTPVARRRPQVLAHQLATLAAAAPGRVLFGAGLGGGHGEFERFGEDEGEHARAGKLDEGLDVIAALLSGEPVDHHGEHYTVSDVTLKPAPDPRIPIWIGGMSKKARARAARFDGWFADTASPTEMTTTPDELMRMLEGYELGDVAVMGNSNAADALHREYEDAGATWWIEQILDRRGDAEEMRARVAAGP
jgi:alkanesulfonate monooxygenase SsuD/methylene tetrahydromethanopterin reductase-like flavin-dependent oxidoreductase (luciferase family)